MATIDIGSRLGKQWLITGHLGLGGSGQVFQARGLDQSRVAIKILLRGDQQDTLRFLRERFIMEQSPDHQHVIKLIDTGMHDDLPYIVMEIAIGSLDKYLDRLVRIGEQEACWILSMAVSGLRGAKTVHRDLKPGNLLIFNPPGALSIKFTPGDTERSSIIKVADFGLAKDRDPTARLLTQPDRAMGTPAYMSPEQWRNSHNVTIESDIYAIGVMLYQMVVGTLPFDDEDVAVVCQMHDKYMLQVPRDICPVVRAIIEKCMAKDPGDRYRTLMGLEEALRLASGTATPISESAIKVQPPSLMRRIGSLTGLMKKQP